MPGRDGTGPMSAEAGTGRGMGGCVDTQLKRKPPVFGIGRQHSAGRGGMQGRGFAGAYPTTTQKDALEQQRAALQARLDQVDGQLKNL